MAALFAVDVATGDAIRLAYLYVAGPLLLAATGGWRATLAVGLLAVALAIGGSAASGLLSGAQDFVRVGSVVLGSGLAVVIAALRAGIERGAHRERKALALVRAQTDRYEALLLALSEVGEGMLVLGPDGRCVYANAAFEQLSGYTFPELAAMESVMELVIERDREEALERAAMRVERGLVDHGYQLTMRRRDGALARLEVAGVPLEAEDRRMLVVVVRDITARVRAEQDRERALARSALLAEASELFDQSLDEERTMRSVARLCVRELAATCVILIGDSPADVRRVSAVAHDPSRERALLAELLRDPLEERAGHPMLAVMRDGGSVVASDVPGLRTPHAVIVPLRARGRVHGVLAAGFDRLDEEQGTLLLLEDLGRRAALALDNARLYEERDHIARTLQRSLLPAELPEIPGVDLAARYLAAGEGNEVGGDFYDCFATGDGGWALVIGDVCGKGAEAAAVTALARHTLRAAVLHDHRPVAVLGELNEALLRQGLDYRFCTVLYASLTPRDGGLSVTVATGGHPLPLVLRSGGEVETAGSPGTLLGILQEPQISQETLELGPGDALVLFTDGVIEATPADRAAGPGRLAEFLAGFAGTGAAGIAEAVEREAIGAHGGLPRDDVAVVVARVGGSEPAPFGAVGQGVAAPT